MNLKGKNKNSYFNLNMCVFRYIIITAQKDGRMDSQLVASKQTEGSMGKSGGWFGCTTEAWLCKSLDLDQI